jgi:leucyl aminopeptidase
MRVSLLFAAAAIMAPGALATTIEFAAGPAPKDGAIAVIVGKEGLAGVGLDADKAAGGALAKALAAADFKGETGKAVTLYGIGPYSRIVAVGVGDGPQTDADLVTLGGRVAQAVKTGKVTVLTPDVPAVSNDAAQMALGAELGAYDFGKWGKAKKDSGPTLTFLTADAAGAKTAWDRDARAVADGVVLARDLISTPSNIKDPQFFVDRVREAFKGVPNVSIEVLGVPEMQKLGMGMMLGVGQGSARPPRLLVVRYRGAGNAAPVAFVGKGITFDSGGISIKPGEGMWRMRYDMSGAAASVGAVLASAKRGAKANVIGVAALAENMPDGGAIRPGDVLTSMSGKTVEVLNTDAEGRLVLGDAIWFVQERDKPAKLVTIATLTGAVRTALGDDYAGLFANNEAFAGAMQAAATRADEAVWRLPIHPSTYEDIKSDVADVKNVVEGGGTAGASIGAAFIGEWVKPGQAWAHLDIASVAWRNTSTPTTPKGAAGFGVRLFDQFVRDVEAGK